LHQATPATIDIDVDAFTRFEAAAWAQVPDGYHRFFGPIIARAAARGASVAGTDIAPEVLTPARRLHPGITFRLADAHRLDLADASFDAVVAGFLLPHLGDHHTA
jgi:hypothetical protein